MGKWRKLGSYYAGIAATDNTVEGGWADKIQRRWHCFGGGSNPRVHGLEKAGGQDANRSGSLERFEGGRHSDGGLLQGLSGRDRCRGRAGLSFGSTVGLEVGADDYLAKPFSMRELIARVKALLRRVRLIREEAESAALEAEQPKVLTFGNLEIDMTRREVRLDGKVVPCKPKEYELLTFMGQHRGRVLTRELILERVWGWGFVGDSRTVDVRPDPAGPTA